jgi:small-conductance mechanosensitive channel
MRFVYAPLAMKKHFIIQVFSILFIALLTTSLGLAQTNATSTDQEQTETQTKQFEESSQTQVVRRLLAIKQALESRRVRIRELLEQLETADEADKPNIRKLIDDQRDVVRDLTISFENIAASGAVLRNQDATEGKMDWNAELTQIMRPLITSLKDATEKPRRIAELRAEIDIYERQLEVARKASTSIAQFDRQSVPLEVADGLDAIAATWQERSQDIEHSLANARVKLRSFEMQDIEILESIGRALSEFLLGSGLTLVLALFMGLIVWFTLRALQRLVRKWRRSVDSTGYAAKIRLLLYSYNLLTVFLVALAVLTVFYARGDFLLLSLAIIALVMLLLGIWRFLPGYIKEARLLLNLGAAREGERVTYNGLPFHIDSLNLYSELRNPELKGVVRLPLSVLAQLTSRPCIDEPWFPSRAGEYLLMPDGGFAQVLKQTVEMVQLKTVGSLVQYASADFLQLGMRNLSREGFGVIVGFGIDYEHQEISLDRVPERFRSGIEEAFDQAGFGDDLKDLVVDFQEAAASSLDYLIYATLDGKRASSYFKITRLIQQTCVDICNREGWVIPFTQVTVHAVETPPMQDFHASSPQPA